MNGKRVTIVVRSCILKQRQPDPIIMSIPQLPLLALFDYLASSCLLVSRGELDFAHLDVRIRKRKRHKSRPISRTLWLMEGRVEDDSGGDTRAHQAEFE